MSVFTHGGGKKIKSQKVKKGKAKINYKVSFSPGEFVWTTKNGISENIVTKGQTDGLFA